MPLPLPYLSRGNHYSDFSFTKVNFSCSFASYKWTYTLCTLLCQTSLIQHFYFNLFILTDWSRYITDMKTDIVESYFSFSLVISRSFNFILTWCVFFALYLKYKHFLCIFYVWNLFSFLNICVDVHKFWENIRHSLFKYWLCSLSVSSPFRIIITLC